MVFSKCSCTVHDKEDILSLDNTSKVKAGRVTDFSPVEV